MESADSHHQFQDQFLASSSYGSVGTHPWTTTTVPNSILNTNSLSSSSQENSTTTLHPSNMAPDLSFHWANNSNTASSFSTNLSPQYLHLSRIKDELSEHYYRKYTEILSSSSPQSTTTDEYNLHENDVGTKLLFKSFSSGNLMNKVVNSTNGTHGDFYSGNGVRSGFVSQIFPSINISSNDLNHQHPAGAASSLDMNLDALDLLASSRSFNGNFDHSSQNQAGIFRDGFLNYGFDHMQQSHQIPLLYGSNKVSGSSNVVGEAKRTSSKISNMEPKAPIQNAPKKSRVEARASCPPFKVRKEKLGDRIAALQQLVAPFGKTDTASVLMEAIGYIKFLQSQVETLSVPYMKASRNKSSRVMKGGPAENETEEPKRDLKGRGLCLVPLSCLSYITDGGGAAVWPPPHFGGAT